MKRRRGARGMLRRVVMIALCVGIATSAETTAGPRRKASQEPMSSSLMMEEAKALAKRWATTSVEPMKDLERFMVKADKQLVAETMFQLGCLLTDGDADLDVERDLDEGLRLLMTAAKEHGHPGAQHRVALAYATGAFGPVGDLVAQGDGEIEALLHEYHAAKAGDVLAAMGMGYRYLYGHGTPPNCESAVVYYELAANDAMEELERVKILPPNERPRLSETTLGVLAGSSKRRTPEADQQLVEYYEHTAEKGDVGAQVALGRFYLHGSQGVTQDFERAATYFEAAAGAGDPTAAGSAGLLYALGLGVPQNNATAKKYFMQGYEHGDAASLNGLGHLYLYGMGVERNVEKAVKFFQKAAHEKGYSEAMYNLGIVYAGLAGPLDGDNQPPATTGASGAGAQALDKKHPPEGAIAETKKPITVTKEGAKTGASGSPTSGKTPATTNEQADTPKAAASRERVAGAERRKMTSEPSKGGASETASADKAASSENNATEKQGTKKNLQKALKYFSLAAQAGHMAALHRIGQMYSQGIATTKSCSTAAHAFKGVAERGPWVTDMSRAFKLHREGRVSTALLEYIKLAEIGYEVAQANAAEILDHESCQSLPLQLTKLDCERLAVRYYRHASKQGNADASLRVGDAHYYGKAALPVDFERAAQYYQTAAEQRQPQAMFNLGLMHQFGLGLPQDFHLAKRWLDSAAEVHPDARWPVNLSLLGLYVHWWFKGKDAGDEVIKHAPPSELPSMVLGWAVEAVREKVSSGWMGELLQGLGVIEATKPMSTSEGQAGGSTSRGDKDKRGPSAPGADAGTSKGEWRSLVQEFLPAVDTLAIIVLTTALLLVVRMRQRQQEAARRESQTRLTPPPQGQQQPQQQHQQAG